MVSCISVAAGACGGNVERGLNEEPSLAAFTFPADGVDNDNGYVGPFCCTGRTAVVEDAEGAPLGYAYFFGFDGGRIIHDQRSVASTLSILVAGRASLADAASPLVTGQVDFSESDLATGTTRSSVAGALEFEVHLDHVDRVESAGLSYFDMGTVAVSVVARAAR